MGVAGLPAEEDRPLVVDPDAVLTQRVAWQCLEPISGRDAQGHEAVGGMQSIQFAQRRREDLTWEPGGAVGGITVVKIFGRLIAKTDDHRSLLLYRDYMLAV